MVIIGYSGHAFVACSILKAAGLAVTAYCDKEEKALNPFHLKYLGEEDSEQAIAAFKETPIFIGVGNNGIRKKIYHKIGGNNGRFINAVHPSAIICPTTVIGSDTVMIAAGAIIQPLAVIGAGVICNTGSIIEHECNVGAFAHIGPGTVLCGNVSIGEGSFIGAGAVVRQGISIGRDCMIGAGSVVVKNVPDNTTVVGVPAR